MLYLCVVCIAPYSCLQLQQEKRAKLQMSTLCAMLLTALAAGALIPTCGYQLMLGNERHERQLFTARIIETQADIDEIRVQLVVAHQKLSRCGGGNASDSAAPDYSSVDRVIEEPPNDSAARTLYYELAYAFPRGLYLAHMPFSSAIV